MKKSVSLATAIGLTTSVGAVAGSAHADGPPQATFEVTVSNVSEFGQLDTDVAGGMIPLSPGVWALTKGADNPLFDVGEPASDGIEDVAEDGQPAVLLEEAADINRVRDSAVFPDPLGPITSGNSYTFHVTASPGERLHLVTMFVQSNDYFYADANGIPLFHGNTPISGDVTDALALYDAGTEVDEVPGAGAFQVLTQPSLDSGPAENSVVVPAAEDGFDLPADEDVIQVTVTPIG